MSSVARRGMGVGSDTTVPRPDSSNEERKIDASAKKVSDLTLYNHALIPPDSSTKCIRDGTRLGTASGMLVGVFLGPPGVAIGGAAGALVGTIGGTCAWLVNSDVRKSEAMTAWEVATSKEDQTRAYRELRENTPLEERSAVYAARPVPLKPAAKRAPAPTITSQQRATIYADLHARIESDDLSDTIYLKPYVDPVRTPDGITYERATLAELIAKGGPMAAHLRLPTSMDAVRTDYVTMGKVKREMSRLARESVISIRGRELATIISTDLERESQQLFVRADEELRKGLVEHRITRATYMDEMNRLVRFLN